jgi:hypothetical protein
MDGRTLRAGFTGTRRMSLKKSLDFFATCYRSVGDLAEVVHRSTAPARSPCARTLLLVTIQANKSGLFDAARLLCVSLCAGQPAKPP